jgi:hypothetical protein
MTELNEPARITAPRTPDDLEWSACNWLRRVARKNSCKGLFSEVDDREQLRVATDTA